MVALLPAQLCSNRLRPSDGWTVGHCKVESPWIYDHVSGFSQNALWVRHAVINLPTLTEDEDTEKEEHAAERKQCRGWRSRTCHLISIVKTWRFVFDCVQQQQRLGPDRTLKKGAGWEHRRGHCGKIKTQFDAKMFPWHLISIKLRNLNLRSCFWRPLSTGRTKVDISEQTSGDDTCNWH